MKDYHINIFYSEEDNGYIADIPDLVACSAFGAGPVGRHPGGPPVLETPPLCGAPHARGGVARFPCSRAAMASGCFGRPRESSGPTA